mmetsp:Transcript_91006/g.243657  ORF Transcript_91006/g.243657 Transcript_91006/m.243657 type:complete len:304 (+) Transcript_91006:1267-2178(+)
MAAYLLDRCSLAFRSRLILFASVLDRHNVRWRVLQDTSGELLQAVAELPASSIRHLHSLGLFCATQIVPGCSQLRPLFAGKPCTGFCEGSELRGALAVHSSSCDMLLLHHLHPAHLRPQPRVLLAAQVHHSLPLLLQLRPLLAHHQLQGTTLVLQGKLLLLQLQLLLRHLPLEIRPVLVQPRASCLRVGAELRSCRGHGALLVGDLLEHCCDELLLVLRCCSCGCCQTLVGLACLLPPLFPLRLLPSQHGPRLLRHLLLRLHHLPPQHLLLPKPSLLRPRQVFPLIQLRLQQLHPPSRRLQRF